MTHPIKEWRQSQDPPLTQAALGRLIGVSRQAVMRWESGRRQPRDEHVIALVQLGVDAIRLRPALAAAVEAARFRTAPM